MSMVAFNSFFHQLIIYCFGFAYIVLNQSNHLRLFTQFSAFIFAVPPTLGIGITAVFVKTAQISSA